MVINIKRFFTKLIYLGVTADLDPTFAKRIILTNILGILFGVNMSISALGFFYVQNSFLGVFTIVFVLSELSWLYLNHLKLYNFSRLGMLVSSNLLGFAVSVYLPDTNYNQGFLVMAGLPLLLFDLSEKRSIALGLLLPLFLLPLSEWGQHHFNLIYRLELTDFVATFIKYAIGMIYVTLIFLMFLFLSRENARAEDELGKALTDLEAQRERAFSSAKFAALGEMAGGIAHEINNPMTAIVMISQHLKHILNDKVYRKEMALEQLEKIFTIVRRVARITDAMRTFSRDSSNDLFRKEPLQTIIEETLELSTEKLRKHGIQFELKSELGDYELNCRAVQISQVILNLLNNAVDGVEFLKERWIRLEARLTNTHVILVVTDSGNGISQEEANKIFQPFYTTKPVGKGTGLGLSLSRKIIDDHGGTLSVDSTSPNTRFVIELPR